MTRVLAGLLIAGLGFAGAASAESHITDDMKMAAVKARQSTMQLYAFNLGQLGNMAKGAMAYDADLAKAAAGNLVKLSTTNQMAMWLPGTDNASMEGTKALPAIWEDMDGIMAASKAMVDASMAMEEAAGDEAAMKAAMGDLGKSCGGCHQNFRASN
ncbi:c-type cytochrome [Pseudooceanicola sp. C21-150M6]|uniref:c-type cytochrome n=1 Tax=Pseudooceanicola sp. C21-150M6 TaxID=3434355 RepID=UPI003D7FDD0B